MIYTIPLSIAAGNVTALRLKVDTDTGEVWVRNTADDTWILVGDVAIPDHNDLAGLQGGTADEYYHLAETIYDNLVTHGSYDFLKTGFDRDISTKCSMAFVGGTTRKLTLTPSPSFDYWIAGIKYTVSTPQEVTIEDIEGNWYIYFEGDTLTSSQDPWEFDASKAFVAVIYWDATNNQSIHIQYEMHAWEMDDRTHELLHDTLGTRWETGLAVSINGANLDVTEGSIHDEDIDIHIVDDDTPDTFWEQALTLLSAPILYRSGASGAWRKFAASTTPVYLSSNIVQLNVYAGGSWGWSPLSLSKYGAYWVIASGDIDYPIFLVPGQEEGATLAAARDGNKLIDMSFGSLPTPEYKVIARILVQRIAGSPYYTIEEVNDYRNAVQEPTSSFSATDHGGLTGLLDDDHPHYVLNTGDTITGQLTITSSGTYDLYCSAKPNYFVYGVGIGVAPTALVRLNTYMLQTDPVGDFYGIYSDTRIKATGASARYTYGVYTSAAVTSDTVANVTGHVVGMSAYSLVNSTSAITVSTVSAIKGTVQIDAAATAVTTTAYAGYFIVTNLSSAGATIGTAYGLYIGTPTVTGAITNVYGLYIANQTGGGTLNYAIYTGTGLIRFGGAVTLSHTLTTSGTAGVSHATSFDQTTGTFYGYNLSVTQNLTSGNSTAAVYGFIINCVQPVSSTASTGGIRSLTVNAAQRSSGAMSYINLVELGLTLSSSGLVSNTRAIRITAPTISGGGQATNTYGILIDNQSWSAATNSYAFYISSQSGVPIGGTMYSIYTNAGINRLGDQLMIYGGKDIIQFAIRGTATSTKNHSLSKITSNVATITTTAAHGFQVGGQVVVAGCTYETDLNGTRTITSVPTTTTFTFAITHADVAEAAETGTSSSSQSLSLQEWQNSAGTVQSAMSGDGRLGLGLTYQSGWRLYGTWTTADPSVAGGGVYSTVTSTYSAAPNTSQQSCFLGNMIVKVNTGITVAGNVSVMKFSGYIDDAHLGTISEYWGNYIYSAIETGAGGAVTNWRGLYITHYSMGANTLAYTNWYGLYITDISGLLNGATITNHYGIYLENIDAGGTTNYAIYTNSGNIVFNGGSDPAFTFAVKTDAAYNAIYVDGADNSIKIMTNAAGKIGFFGAAAIVQPSGTGETNGFTQNSGDAVNDASTFTGNNGATAYRINDVVKALKNLGLLAI